MVRLRNVSTGKGPGSSRHALRALAPAGDSIAGRMGRTARPLRVNLARAAPSLTIGDPTLQRPKRELQTARSRSDAIGLGPEPYLLRGKSVPGVGLPTTLTSPDIPDSRH